MMQTHDPESLNSSFDGSDYGQEMDFQVSIFFHSCADEHDSLY
jgi:hypothetical protein